MAVIVTKAYVFEQALGDRERPGNLARKAWRGSSGGCKASDTT